MDFYVCSVLLKNDFVISPSKDFTSANFKTSAILSEERTPIISPYHQTGPNTVAVRSKA